MKYANEIATIVAVVILVALFGGTPDIADGIIAALKSCP